MILKCPHCTEVFALEEISTVDRFWAHVEKTDGCWNWTSKRNHAGYGVFTYQGKPYLAHRALFWLMTGEWPAATELVLHACDNPRCVNPAHLSLGTHRDNSRDMARKLRSAHRKLSPEQVVELRRRHTVGDGYKKLAREFGVGRSLVMRIVKRQAWAWLEELH